MLRGIFLLGRSKDEHTTAVLSGERRISLSRWENFTGPTHIGDVARGAGTPRSGGAAERRLDGIAYVAPREQFL